MNLAETQRLAAAVALAAEVHHGQCRDEGTPYIEHPIRVALIAAEELALSDPDVLCAAYLHDAVEDAADPAGVRERILATFGEWVLQAVDALTKPQDRSVPKDERNRVYLERLNSAPREVRLLKVADRLDNARFLGHSPDAKKRGEYLRETEEVYLPLAESLGVLQEELRAAVREVRERYGPDGQGPGE